MCAGGDAAAAAAWGGGSTWPGGPVRRLHRDAGDAHSFQADSDRGPAPARALRAVVQRRRVRTGCVLGV